MSIARLRKVSLFGAASDRTAMLEGLQDLGCAHLVPLTTPARPDVPEAAPDAATVEDARTALRFLTDAPTLRRPALRDPAFSFEATVTAALEVRKALRDARDARDFLRERMADVRRWGDVRFSPLESLDGYRLWFYELPLKDRPALDGVETPWAIVGVGRRFLHVVLISRTEPPADILPTARTHIGAESLSALSERLEATQARIEELEMERHRLTRFIGLLSVNLAAAEDRAAREDAARGARAEGGAVALQGWVPEDRIADVEAFAREHGLALLSEAPQADEAPPTLIEQPPRNAAGVDLALFYKAPGYRDWDPTVVTMASFVAFFAMILADAGYGLVLLAGLALAWRRLGRSARGRAWRRLWAILGIASVVYGALVGSYFGVSPTPGTTLAALKRLSIDDFDAMMTLSVGVGVGHVALANFIQARVHAGDPWAWSRYGWMALVIGGFALWKAPPGSAGASLGLAAMIAGAAGVALFSGAGAGSVGGRVFAGVRALAGSMGAFGDVLSYMRLFALGLASASLAVTFNELAASARAELPGLGLLAALLILILGHALNFALAVMSGVVHGLRLNFIEFYNWGLPGEGTPFRRFARKEAALWTRS